MQDRRFVALDGLRGLAALLIVLYHVRWTNHLSGSQFIQNSYLAVDLFFILSGFVISWAYRGRIGSAADAYRFLTVRLFRVSCPRFLWTPYCSEKLEDRQHGR